MRVAAGADAAVAPLRDGALAAIICDYELPGTQAPSLYQTAARVRPTLSDRFILMTGICQRGSPSGRGG